MSFQILGTGHFVPKKILNNEELSEIVDTSDEWIMKRIGVKERHICTTETAVNMGTQAALQALEAANVKPEELDLILGTTISGDTISPGLACMVQNQIGATCPAMDLAAACSGFVFALDVAAGYFARKTAKKILIVSSERTSGLIDWTDRGTCCIFGDGSGAVVLGEGDGYIASHLETQGGEDVITIPIHSDKSPFYENELKDALIFMNGQETYKFAVTKMTGHIQHVMSQAGISGEDVSWVVAHQANYRIINEARRRMPEISPEKFLLNIEKYGNTSSASVPILLDEAVREEKIKKGDIVVLAAFGGGLSSGAAVLKW
jgi:3-oxoacyl-(acyl-carrier-protein) synthase III